MSPAESERVTIAAPYRTERARRSTSLGGISLHTEAAGASHPEAFGQFRVLHQIGAGALGPVFRAYDPDQDRLVAVKLFQLDLQRDRVESLVTQLQTLIDADLTHPAIAAPIATGVVDSTAYLALDFVASDTPDLFARGHPPVPTADAIRMVAQLAAALDFAVDASVVHGALHPRDVLVSADDARITGIGIAQVLARVGVATPVRRPYTAPERAAGAAWDRRADVFSLAAIVHELLWGRRIAAIGRHAAAALTPLAGADLDALRRLFGEALAEDPADRFESATEFSDALRSALTGRIDPGLPLGAAAAGDDRRTVDAPMAFTFPEERASVNPPPVDPPIDEEPQSATLSDLDRTMSDADTRPAVLRLAFDSEEHEEPDDEPDQEREATIVYTPPVTPAPPPVFEVPEEPVFEVPERVVVERTRSAIWPLTMALGVGLAVGFALGYSVAGREEPAALHTTAPLPVPPSVAPNPDVAGTDVSVKPSPSSPSSEPAPPSNAAAPPSSEASRRVDDAAPQEAASAPSAARLLIRSTPPGAEAFLDGRAIGRTPLTERDVESGSHVVRVTREGFVPQERRVSVRPSQPFQTLSFDLARTTAALPAPSTPGTLGRAPGVVNIDSRPSGANVIVDGKAVGVTPTTLTDLAGGKHTIELELEGYRRWRTSVNVIAGERYRVAASLEP